MSGPDDTSRERHDRPTDPPQSPPGAEENGHAIPFGEGVYGLGRTSGPARQQPRAEREPAPEPPPGDPRTSERPGYSPDSGTFAEEIRRLAADLGFEGHTEGRQCVGFCPICRSADLLRTFATPELREAWNEFQHELARALRAAAARYAEAEPGEPEAQRITEIPIE